MAVLEARMLDPERSPSPWLPGIRSRYFSPSRLFGRSVTRASEKTGAWAGSRETWTSTLSPLSWRLSTLPARAPAISTSLPG